MDDLKKYIEEQRREGFTDLEIREALIRGGWKEEQFKEVFSSSKLSTLDKSPQVNPPEPLSQREPKKKHNIWAIILFLLLFSIIIGGGIAAVWWFWLSPQKQLFGAYQQLRDLKSFSYTMTLEFTVKKDRSNIPLPFLSSIGSMNRFQLKGALEKLDEKTVNFSALINLPNGFGKLDIRAIDRVIYGKLESKSTKIIQGLDMGLEQFYNKWYSYDISRIEEELGDGFLPSQSTLTGKQYDELTSLLAKHRFLKVKQDKRLDSVDGRRLRYIIVIIDKDKLADFLFESQKFVLDAKDHKTHQEIRAMYEQDGTFVDDSSFHVWLDMKSFPVRVKWVFEEPDFSTSITVDISDINKKALITKPEGNIASLNDLFKQWQKEIKNQQENNSIEDKKSIEGPQSEVGQLEKEQSPRSKTEENLWPN